MGDKSNIEWTDATWNPVLGCSKVSPGCDNCYAISMSHRIEATGNPAYEGLTTRVYDHAGAFMTRETDWTGTIRCLPERLDQPLRWKRPRRIFVNSMSDLFHPDVPENFIWEVFGVMERARQHQFQILTKRPQRMARVLGSLGEDADDEIPEVWPLANVWAGTSIESDRYTFRARHLAATPAVIRFLSLEPLLGPLPSLDLDGIGWVIVGGESGPGARPMHPDWVRSIRDRCQEAGVPFFFKQWGAYTWERTTTAFAGTVTSSGLQPRRVDKKLAGRELDGRTWEEYPDG